MQSRLDAERIIVEMKADANRVHVTGNLKFDNVPGGVTAEPSDYGLDAEHRVLLAASTHPGEEDILLDIFRSLKRTDPALRLVLVPRHRERAFSIAVGQAVRIEPGLCPCFFPETMPSYGRKRSLLSIPSAILWSSIPWPEILLWGRA